jgi:hypothetical protein
MAGAYKTFSISNFPLLKTPVISSGNVSGLETVCKENAPLFDILGPSPK